VLLTLSTICPAELQAQDTQHTRPEESKLHTAE
jgi:hypothetical protein